MTDLAKQIHAGGGSFLSDFKNLFSVFKTRRTMVAYGFLFTVIACTVFIAFSPSSNSSAPWFNNIFSSSSTSTSYGSQLSSFFSSFFPNSSVPMLDNNPNITRSLNTTSELQKQAPPSNQTDVKQQPVLNQTVNGSSASSSGVKNETSSMNKTVTEQSRVDNYTSSLSKQTNSNSSSTSVTSGNNSTKDEKLKNNKVGNFSSLMHCDIFDGNWVKDDSYPLYSPGSCPLIDEQFNCFINGRPDRDFQKYRWQPKDCNIPRLNGKDMLELLRGKRLAFVGDSLNRNMWESLICILRNSVSDKSKVFEGSGRREFRTEHSYLFVFKDYNCTVEFFRSPFLVQEWELPETDGSKKETLRLDLVESSSSKYKDADYIVFNTGHWWTHEKTSKGKDYYQEGSHVYEDLNVVEAFRKALTTWARWVDANINPTKSLVLFRGYSASHFRGGQWNSGGQCNDETEPIKNNTYLSKYPPKMRVLEKVLKNMKTPVAYLNITRMTDFRKDAHPSVYRKQNLSAEERKSPLRFQDCSHWCLPGVPDSWNELLYARLLIKQQEQQQKQKQHRLITIQFSLSNRKMEATTRRDITCLALGSFYILAIQLLDNLVKVYEKLGPPLFYLLLKREFMNLSFNVWRELGRQLLECVSFIHDVSYMAI